VILTRALVHVWWVALDIPLERVGMVARLLSDDERARADSFHFDRDRRRYIAGRGALRQLLGAYLVLEPGRLQFRYGGRGKPYVVGSGGSEGLRFNVSNSDDLAVIAVCRDREVGVDLEAHHPLEDVDQIATRYFCVPEREALLRANGEHKQILFYTYWTRKEALLKATGTGLSSPLTSIDVSQASEAAQHPYVVADGSGASRRFGLVDLHPAGSYLGAVAAEGAGWRIHDQGFVEGSSFVDGTLSW
jgi:4'-phosphopantetheinyl transferase